MSDFDFNDRLSDLSIGLFTGDVVCMPNGEEIGVPPHAQDAMQEHIRFCLEAQSRVLVNVVMAGVILNRRIHEAVSDYFNVICMSHPYGGDQPITEAVLEHFGITSEENGKATPNILAFPQKVA